MYEYIIKSITSLIPFFVIMIPFWILFLKSNKTKDNVLKNLEIGQEKIFIELKVLHITITDMKKEHDDLFEHKEGCLKHRIKCAQTYMTHEDYDRLQKKVV